MLVRLAGGKQKRLDCVGSASGALASLPSQTRRCADLQHRHFAALDLSSAQQGWSLKRKPRSCSKNSFLRCALRDVSDFADRLCGVTTLNSHA